MGIMKRVAGALAGAMLGAAGTAAGSAGAFAVIGLFESDGGFLAIGPGMAVFGGFIFGGGVGVLGGALVSIIRPTGSESFMLGALLALFGCGLFFGDSSHGLPFFYLLGLTLVTGAVCGGVAQLVGDPRAPQRR